MLDVSPDAQQILKRMHPKQAEILRRLSPARKLELAAQFYFESVQLKTAALRSLRPGFTDDEIRSRVKELFLRATG